MIGRKLSYDQTIHLIRAVRSTENLELVFKGKYPFTGREQKEYEFFMKKMSDAWYESKVRDRGYILYQRIDFPQPSVLAVPAPVVLDYGGMTSLGIMIRGFDHAYVTAKEGLLKGSRLLDIHKVKNKVKKPEYECFINVVDVSFQLKGLSYEEMWSARCFQRKIVKTLDDKLPGLVTKV